jgi:hypothetical protein
MNDPTTDNNLISSRSISLASASLVKPVHDGPPEIEDHARQGVEYPADETDEG